MVAGLISRHSRNRAMPSVSGIQMSRSTIGRVTGIPGSRFGCVGGDRYLIPFVLENIANDLPNIRFVVNNQN